MFFQLSLPQSLLRLLSTFGAALFFNLLAFTRASAFWQYYYQVSNNSRVEHVPPPIRRIVHCNHSILMPVDLCPLARPSNFVQLLASPHGFADLFVGRFISIGALQSYWRAPTIRHLLVSQVPLGFIYGADDDIMPWHQARTAANLCGTEVPVCLVPNTGHAPYSQDVASFSLAFHYVSNRSCKPAAEAATVAAQCTDKFLGSFKSCYSLRQTAATIESLYSALQASDPVSRSTAPVMQVHNGHVIPFENVT